MVSYNSREGERGMQLSMSQGLQALICREGSLPFQSYESQELPALTALMYPSSGISLSDSVYCRSTLSNEIDKGKKQRKIDTCR